MGAVICLIFVWGCVYNLQTSGANAQDENIADNGGIKQSFYVSVSFKVYKAIFCRTFHKV